MAKVKMPFMSVWASGSLGRSTIYCKPRQYAPGKFTFSIERCKGKLTRYMKNKIYGSEGPGRFVAKYWKIYRLKSKQAFLIKKFIHVYAPPD